MPLVKSEYACPACKATTGQSSQIVANAGQLICSANPAHTWNDTQAFLALRPTMEFKVKMVTTPQEGYEPITVRIPIKLKAEFEQRYGNTLSQKVSELLNQLAEGETTVLSQVDVQKITERLGKKFDGGSELAGMIYAMSCELSDARQEAANARQEVQAYEGMGKTKVVIDLGDEYQRAVDNARNNSLPLKHYIQSSVQNALSQSWF